MSFFKKIIGVKAKEPEETETISQITKKLESLEPYVAKYHALFACILSRVAHADLDISEVETNKMKEILEKSGHLTPEMAALVVEIAKVQNILLGGVENYILTREFAQTADRVHKEYLLESLFAVAAADESVSTQESNEISKIATEMGLEHKDYIAARSKFREYLAVLKG